MKTIILVLSALFSLLCTCGLGIEVVGGSTNTSNARVVGTLVNENGTPAVHAVVACIPADYIPGISHDSLVKYHTTNDSGRYVFDAVDSGLYVITAKDPVHLTRCMVTGILVHHDTVTSKQGMLSLPGSLKVLVPDSADLIAGIFYIPGTAIAAPLLSKTPDGYVILDSVPSGTVPNVSYASILTKQSAVMQRDVVVPAGGMVIVENAATKYRRKIQLNTTPNGADVANRVANFPVLVRLSSANFDFSKAKKDGSDIWFTKSDNALLSYEIERWDSVSRLAEVWVKIDTVQGNDSTQFIMMYWGTQAGSANQSLSSGTNVFDTALGFRGVWHLGESASSLGAKGIYKDATSNNFNGDNFVSTNDNVGIIGKGVGFNGISDYIHVNAGVTNFQNDFTVSAWVNIARSYGGSLLLKGNADTIWDRGENCLYFGDGSTFKTKIAWTSAYNGLLPSFVGYNNSYAIANTQIPSQSWHHVSYTFQWDKDTSGVSHWYLDGIEIGLSVATVISKNYNDSASTIWIGRGNNNEARENFGGSMDELEISNVVRSPDWIKLCFMNQRADNKLVVFK